MIEIRSFFSRRKCLFSLGFFLTLGLFPVILGASTLSVIQYPIINRPILTEPGGTITIECQTGPSAGGWEAKLQMPYKEVTLAITVGDYVDGVRTLSAALPGDTHFELYDLWVKTPDGTEDIAPNAVRVLPDKNRFTFIHIPDCHLPSVAWIGFYDDANSIPEFLQIVGEANIIQPDFILQTGDIVDNGQDPQHFQIVRGLLENLDVPIFLTGGNHDLWYSGHNLWHDYFGETMDYSFLRDDVRFIGLEMYDTPSKTYTPDQMNWLQEELNNSIDAGEGSRIIFTHFDESQQLTGDFVDQYLVDAIIYGHTHLNSEQRIGLRQGLKLNTSFTMNDNGEYSLMKVDNGVIVEYPLLKFKNLWMNISPENNGSSWKMQADIHNYLENQRAGFSGQGVDLEDVVVKLHVDRAREPYTVTGGDVLQTLDYGTTQRIYYVTADVPSGGVTTVTLEGQSTGNAPPMITSYSPVFDTTIYGGQTLSLQIQAEDDDNPSLAVEWKQDGNVISGQTGTQYDFTPPVDFQGQTTLWVSVSDGTFRDSHQWTIYVEPSSGKPELTSSVRNFFPHDQQVILEWIEPVEGNGILEYGLVPGTTIGSIAEDGSSNRVRFIPANENMGLGIYFCRIQSGGLTSDEFPIIIESPQAPNMISPVGDVTTVAPVFQWEPVQGVPYYLLLLTDQEIVITTDPETGEYSLEGANPIWAVITPENSVTFGAPDPSGNFTNYPAPLTPGEDYWWIVLNCYGNAPELVSTVQSGVSQFHIDLPLPDLNPPDLISPENLAELSGDKILFRWSAVSNAVGYHFYPYKIELEEGIEVVRPVWESVITTTNTLLEYDAKNLFAKGSYQWKVAALAEDGTEVPSESRRFQYDAPFTTLNIKTWNNRGTQSPNDDDVLPRVTVSYDAISGVDMGLPLSTDEHGNRSDLIFSPGVYIFTSSKDGFAPSVDTLTLVEGQTIQVDFRLTPDPSTLIGEVRDLEDAGIAAATVTAQHSLHPDIKRINSTNHDGQFSLSLIPGPWIVTALKNGYTSQEPVSISVESGAIKSLTSPLLLIRNENEISGTVINPNGQSIYGAQVSIAELEDSQQSTDANGRFLFNVSDGTWQIIAGKTGFTSPTPRSITVTGGQSVEISPSIELTPAGAIISGSVNDGHKAVAAATVRAVPASGSVITQTSDSYGQFNIPLIPGTYSLTAEKSGYSSGPAVEVSLESGETFTGVQLTLSENTAIITGLVTSDGITPVPGADVSANGSHSETSDGGRYKLQIDAGTFDVSATKNGYLSGDPVEVTLTPGQTVDGVDFILTPNASTIKGRVIADNAGVAGAQVIATNGTTTLTSSDDDGYFDLNVMAGLYTVTAMKTGFVSDTLDVTIGQAQVIENKDISLTRNTAIVQGTVTNQVSGDALPGATVSILGDGQLTNTLVDGTYRLELAATSTGYQIQASKQGFGSYTLPSGVLTAGEALTLNFALEAYPTRLAGWVKDENNQRLEGAKIQAEIGVESYSAISEADGTFDIALPSASRTYSVTVSKPGYRFDGGAQVFTLAAGEDRSDVVFVLNSHFAGLSGKVKRLDNGDFIGLANLQISNSQGPAGSTQSADGSGQFAFINTNGSPFLAEGIYGLTVTKPGFADTTISGIALTGSATTNIDVSLRAYSGYLEGTVTDGSTGIRDVTVTAEHQTSGLSFTSITDGDGLFRINPIPTGQYNITASRSGYTASGAALATTPATGILLVLAENTGRIWGYVQDAESGDGLPSVAVQVMDGHGNESNVTSASDGSYYASLLPTLYNYTITASRAGYYTTVKSDLSPTKGDTTRILMQRIYGSITGTITMEDGSSPEDVVVKAINGGSVYTATADASGTYLLSDLPGTLYYLSASSVGYGSNPTSFQADLSQGGTIDNLDFTMEQVTLSSLSITGPSSIMAGGSGSFSFSASSTTGRNMSISPVWSVSHPLGLDSLSVDGVLYPKPDFVGSLWLLLQDTQTGFRDSTTVQIVTRINPGDDAHTFQDYRGGLFQLPANAVVQPVTFGLKYPLVPNVKRNTITHKLVGDLYSFQPAYLTLATPMTLTLPVPEFASSASVMGRWDRSTLKWELQDGIPAGNGLMTQDDVLAQWAIMSPSEPLGIQGLTLTPNPFSPELAPLTVSFTPSSRISTHLTVDITIYNMNGDRVRRLIHNEFAQKDQLYQVQWNGQTDIGTKALNGRYLIHIEVDDGNGKEQVLKPVVLIK